MMGKKPFDVKDFYEKSIKPKLAEPFHEFAEELFDDIERFEDAKSLKDVVDCLQGYIPFQDDSWLVHTDHILKFYEKHNEEIWAAICHIHESDDSMGSLSCNCSWSPLDDAENHNQLITNIVFGVMEETVLQIVAIVENIENEKK